MFFGKVFDYFPWTSVSCIIYDHVLSAWWKSILLVFNFFLSSFLLVEYSLMFYAKTEHILVVSLNWCCDSFYKMGECTHLSGSRAWPLEAAVTELTTVLENNILYNDWISARGVWIWSQSREKSTCALWKRKTYLEKIGTLFRHHKVALLVRAAKQSAKLKKFRVLIQRNEVNAQKDIYPSLFATDLLKNDQIVPFHVIALFSLKKTIVQWLYYYNIILYEWMYFYIHSSSFPPDEGSDQEITCLVTGAAQVGRATMWENSRLRAPVIKEPPPPNCWTN